ncbi:unnamed protein product [Effrenium voratum]|uniref:Reverse transcriptase Ty1/copia-type domain-containing protein n=1 Tax=Effrenium voratum TaxID=2562239 RepID=A0AA36HXP2_9DINO|nr:unnamed protein product [Effrenium voratum]
MAMIHMEKEIAQRETLAVKIPDSDKYDFSREEKTDPRDPRAQGPPCNGTHEPMPMGRGSLSGKNGHAMWLTCQRCRIRLSYVPAIGAHARFRQSPPLAKDVEDILKEKINEAETQPEILNTANVALDGAERSLMKKLDAVRAQKETAYQRSKMNLSKKMAKRVGEETAEEAALFNEAANTVEMVEEAMADVESMHMMNSKLVWNKPWVGYFRWHEMTHVLFLVDEASTFVPHLFTTKGESRNAAEVVDALESTVRFFGHSTLRLDPEGAFSRLLEWCAKRDVELLPCAAEAHWQIGTVEHMIGVIRKSLDRFMRSEETTMWQGVMAMCAAHNENGKVGGFSPNQWALGRDPGLDLKLHESGRDAAPLHLSQRDPKDELSKTMAIRMRAEESYKRMVAQEEINRAWNSRARSNEVYLPGSLVYYKRFKAPAQAASHEGADASRKRLAKWYGPARVLATETKLIGEEATPSRIIWIVAAGRLKRVSPDQLRMASPREVMIEEATRPASFPWTMHGMLEQVEKGEFDDYKDLYPDGGLDASRMLRDPTYAPSSSISTELSGNRQFAAARKRHGVNFAEPVDQFMVDIGLEEQSGNGEAMVFLSVDLPDNEKGMKKFRRDPETWVAHKVKKSPEIKLHKVSAEKQEEFKAAKGLEVTQWIQSAACRAVEKGKYIPADRIMKMRWVLTVKSTGRAKARIVIVGFADPDLERLPRSSPTMTRRTRQLMAGMAVKGWSQLKCDAKSAFLQTSRNTEEEREIYALPVPELAEAMNVEHRQAVQVLKSCYGLVNAPYQWFCEVRDRIVSLGGQTLITEPCCWRIKNEEAVVIGLVGSHVDDFYMVGDEQADGFDHCGIYMQQLSNREITMDHSKYCSGITQVSFEDRDVHDKVYSQRMLCPKFQNLGCTAEETMLVCWTDAALASRADGGSTGGFVVALTALEMALGQRAPLTLESMKLKRVARSSLAAEVQAFSEGEQELMWCRGGEDGTDAKSLYDSVTKGDAATSGMGLSDKYSALELMSVRERIQEGQTVIRWVHSGAQLADALTKHLVNSSLVKALTTGAWTLVDDPTFTSLKKRRAGGLMDVEKTPAERRIMLPIGTGEGVSSQQVEDNHALDHW